MKRYVALVGVVLLTGWVRGAVEDYLLPNGEPIVGVYYYPWFSGEPYRHTGWTPEFEYDNVHNEAHIRSVLRSMTDYGINQASFSYWDNERYRDLLQTHFQQAEALARQGRYCSFSPYLEPRTIDKVFASPAAQDANTEFITTFLNTFGKNELFCTIGGQPLTNIYVTYYRPNESDEDFRSFLKETYGDIGTVRTQWAALGMAEGNLPESWADVSLKSAEPGTPAHADRQALRAQRLHNGWQTVIDRVEQNTGMRTRYTGDVSRTIISPVDYMHALTGMSWYSFGYPLINPSRRPKLISEIAKYTGTTFLNTIAPGYVDRQQRWGGGRVERTPFLYPYAWVKAIQSLPEGIMILTHSEWYEGSIIDVTKEYGRREYETTELYASIFKAAFRSIHTEKQRVKPLAVVFNEWSTYSLYTGGRRLNDVYGAIKFCESLSLPFDVIPERYLSADTLAGRRLVLVPGCGDGLRTDAERALAEWCRGSSAAAVVADYGEEQTWSSGGRRVVLDAGTFGDFHDAFLAAAKEGEVPSAMTDLLLAECRSVAPGVFAEHVRPEPTGEIAAGPVLSAGDTRILTVSNVLPWGYIVNHRSTGWGLGKGYSRENMKPLERLSCSFGVSIDPALPVADVTACDSDGGRFRAIDHRVEGDRVMFRDRVKFYGLYSIVQSPVRLRFPEMTVAPGQNARIPLAVKNLTENPVSGTIRLASVPGLHMMPVIVDLGPAESQTVELGLDVALDYASGNRTVCFEFISGSRRSVWWRPLVCSLPACLGSRTGVLAGAVGDRVRRDVSVINVGEAEAREVTLQLLDGKAALPDLAPGEEAMAEVTFTVPDAEEKVVVPDVSLVLSVADSGTKSDGLTTKSGVDGQTDVVVRAGRTALRPDPARTHDDVKNQMIYLFVDDERLPAGAYHVEAVVDYFDEGSGSFMIEYDSAYGDAIEDRYCDSRVVALRDTRQWRQAVLRLPNARFAGRQNLDADLRINGVVPISGVRIRGSTSNPIQRQREKMTLRFTQFGQQRQQELSIDIVALRPGEKIPGRLSPYGGHVPPAFVSSSAVCMPDSAGDLQIADSDQMTAVFDREGGGLACIIDKTTGREVTAFPGPIIPVMLEDAEGKVSYHAPADVVWDDNDQALKGSLQLGSRLLGVGWRLEIEDRWRVSRDSPHVSLERRIRCDGKSDVRTLLPAVVRLDSEQFDMVMPLGVGFSKDGTNYGWLESWYSQGWYLAYRGNPRQVSQAVVVTIQPLAAEAPQDLGVRRFRYGFMPAADLPAASTSAEGNELQIQLRNSADAGGRFGNVALRIDVYVLSGVSFRAARELGQIAATPQALRRRWAITKSQWDELDGIQTIVPTAPQYMFDVRQPEWLSEVWGEE